MIELVNEGQDLTKLKVGDITAKAGIGKGTAYEYFSSKEEIVEKADEREEKGDILGEFYNDVTNKVYDTDSQIQDHYYRQMQKMIAELRKLDPDFHFFLHDWHRPLSMYKGGTIHTVVRQPEFTLRTQDDVTMAYWLSECVEGRPFDVGMQLMLQG